MKRRFILVSGWFLIFGLTANHLYAAPPVETPKRSITHTYHGEKVVDPYLWLEQGDSPEVKAWTEKQNQLTRTYFDRLPYRKAIAERLRELYETTSANYSGLQVRKGIIFALKFQPPQQQPMLVRMKSPNDLGSERVVFDPNKYDTNGTTSIDWYVPSLDGTKVAVCLSEKGSEDGSLHFFDAASGEKMGEVIPRVQYPTAGGSAAWLADGKTILYTRLPHPGERPARDLHFYQQVYRHELGTAAKDDKYEIGRDFPKIAEIELEANEEGRQALASVQNGDGGEYLHYVRDDSGNWRQITQYEDQVKQARFSLPPAESEEEDPGAIFLVSRKNAGRGKVLRLPMTGKSVAEAVELIPEGEAVIAGIEPTVNGLYLHEINGGPSQIRFHDFKSKRQRMLNVKGIVAVQQMVWRRGDELLYRTISFLEPYTWYSFDPREGTNSVRTSLRGNSPADFSDVEVVREFAVSKDGTRVPLNIIRKKGIRLDGNNPTILNGYGGYGIVVSPNFVFTRRVWLDQGGVIAIANLRGGGEYGEEWHRKGNLTLKQNVFDDFAACARHLIKSKYTRPERLAIEGGSNGGLLMGAMLTQHPDQVRAVVAHVGIFDMLRVELDPNGEFNTTEFGTVQNLDQYRALHAYSPYHHVADGKRYPAVFMLAGEHDGRVNPTHSRKMTARLQAASRSGFPVLLRMSGSSGHGIGTALDERIAQLADVYAFLFDQLGVAYSQVLRGPWSGAVTPNSAIIKARLARSGAIARLAYSRSPKLKAPEFTAPVMARKEDHKLVEFRLEQLPADTQFYYALEVEGTLDLTRIGTFKTFPGPERASFTFAYSSCGRTGSTNPVYDTIRENQPLFYMNVGDFHYEDISANDVGRFVAAYDRVLASPQQGGLYRSVPFVYMWDDHDFGGNSAHKRAKSAPAARAAYQKYVPHYPLAAGAGDVPIYFTFTVGRVKFIVTDLRSARDNPRDDDNAEKSMMGGEQKEWFKRELLAARDRYGLICWVSSVPWLGQARTNFYPVPTNMFGFIHHTNIDYASMPARRLRSSSQDHWSVFSTERRELADFVKENNIRNLCILHGDSHMLAADDGRNGDFATGGGAPIPVMCGGPLDQNPSLKGGPYSQGVYRVRPGEGCFGLVTVNDRGHSIDVQYSGRNHLNQEKISLRFKVPVRESS